MIEPIVKQLGQPNEAAPPRNLARQAKTPDRHPVEPTLASIGQRSTLNRIVANAPEPR
jgi:hypothetical protein